MQLRYISIFLSILCQSVLVFGQVSDFSWNDNTVVFLKPECKCCYVDTISQLQNDSALMVYLDALKECDEFRSNAGISRNYCNHALLQDLNGIDNSKMSEAMSDMVDYLNDRCLTFHEYLNYPINLCDTSFSATAALPPNLRMEFCEEERDDLDDMWDSMDIRWRNNGFDYTLPDNKMEMPGDGKMHFGISAGLICMCIAGVVGSVFVIKDPMSIPEGLSKKGYDKLSATFLGFTLDILIPAVTIGSGACSFAMTFIGLKREKNATSFHEQSKLLQRNPRVGLQVHFTLEK